MNTRIMKNQWLMLALGLAVGVAITAVCYSWNSTPTSQENVARQLLREKMIHATGSSTSDSFVMSTGRINEDLEGIFTLDGLTGTLNVRAIGRNGKFVGAFKKNVLADLAVDGEKAPKFVMTTGLVDINSSLPRVRPSFCVVYVGDANTGHVACYTLMWDRTAYSRNAPQAGTLTLLDKFKGREAIIQE